MTLRGVAYWKVECVDKLTKRQEMIIRQYVAELNEWVSTNNLGDMVSVLRIKGYTDIINRETDVLTEIRLMVYSLPNDMNEAKQSLGLLTSGKRPSTEKTSPPVFVAAHLIKEFITDKETS